MSMLLHLGYFSILMCLLLMTVFFLRFGGGQGAYFPYLSSIWIKISLNAEFSILINCFFMCVYIRLRLSHEIKKF